MYKNFIAFLLGTLLLQPASAAADSPAKEKNSKPIFLKAAKKENPKLTKLLNDVQNILAGVAAVRQLKVRNKVKVGVKSPQELNQFLRSLFVKEYPDQDLKRDTLLLERLGLIKKNTDLKQLFLDLYTEQIAGFYDNDSKALYIIENSKLGNLELSIIVSHELVHALQDQNFDLKKVLETNKNGDITLARTALIEGEAMIASMQYELTSFKLDLGSLENISGLLKGSLLNTGGMDALKKAPGFLVEQMTFPYIEGSKFVQEVYNSAGNWPGFSNIYNKLPNSTEQILHPEKYLANEQPVAVSLDEKFLGDKSWKFIQKDTFGEFSLMNYFLEYLTEEQAKTAAAGWGGDSFALYSKGTADSLFVFKTLWDTEKDAREFFAAYIKSLDERYGSGIKAIGQNENKYEALTPQGKVYIILNGKSVNIGEGFTEPMTENIAAYLNK
jgi:hypothetical protein